MDWLEIIIPPTLVAIGAVITWFIKSKREEVDLIEETKEDLLFDWENIRQAELDSSLEKFSVIEGNKKIFHKISQMIKESKRQFSIISKAFLINIIRSRYFGKPRIPFFPPLFRIRKKPRSPAIGLSLIYSLDIIGVPSSNVPISIS